MRKRRIIKWIILSVVALLAVYALYLLYVAGFFKSIEPHFSGSCRPVSGIVGAEDITIHPDGRVAYISAADRRASQAGQAKPGAILAYDLTAEDARPVNLTPDADVTFQPHGIGLLVPEQGPARLFVVSHPVHAKPDADPPHVIEIFEVAEDHLVKIGSVQGDIMVSPNDVIPVGPEQFYVTNDHGRGSGFLRAVEEYLMLPWSNVLYYDGSGFSEVASGLRYANGINRSLDGTRIYVASVTGRSVVVYKRDASTGALSEEAEVCLGTGPDNIEVDPEGNLWIGSHAKLLTFLSHASDPSNDAPSQVIRVTPKGNDQFQVEEVFLSDGSDMSGSSVAARYGNRLLIGPVMDDCFLDCVMSQ